MSKLSSFVGGKFNDLGPILRFDAKAMRPVVLLAPLIVGGALAVLISSGVVPLSDDPALRPNAALQAWKGFFEIAAVVALMAATAVSLVRLAAGRHVYFLWLALMMAALTQREIRFEFSNILVHIVVPILFTVAWIWYRQLAKYFTSRWVVTLLVGMFFCYVLSQMLDQRWLQFLPQEHIWSNGVEEPLEMTGHTFALLLVIFSRPGKMPCPLADAPQA